jgi:hypothetical protein
MPKSYAPLGSSAKLPKPEDGIEAKQPKFSRTVEWAVQFEHKSGNKVSVRKSDQIEARAIYDKARIGNNEVAVRLMRYEEVVVAERFNERGSK